MGSENKKIKILQVCAIDETVKSLLLPLIDRLTAEGFDVTSCCTGGKISEKLRKKGYKIKNIDIARSINIKSNFKSVRELMKLMKREKYDVVHVHTPVAALLGRLAAKLSRVPVVIYTAHGFYFHDRMPWLKYKIFLNIEKIAGRLFTHFIFTQSDEDRVTAVKEKIIKSEKIITIGNGVDVDNRFNPKNIDEKVIEKKKAELGITQGDKVVMFVGRLVREKGIIELLEAFNGIKRDNYKLLLIGDRFTGERDTETFDYITNLIKDNPNIIAPGRRSDINDLLFISDVFVLPSYREGMPRSIIEAMAMEKPVVATNIRGCREEVVDGETGYLVEVNNAGQLREKILNILDNPKTRDYMGKKGRERALELFDENKVLDREIERIRQLASRI